MLITEVPIDELVEAIQANAASVGPDSDSSVILRREMQRRMTELVDVLKAGTRPMNKILPADACEQALAILRGEKP